MMSAKVTTKHLLEERGGGSILYDKTSFTEGPGDPVIVYVPGFMSGMEGNKARFLKQHCTDRGYNFVR